MTCTVVYVWVKSGMEDAFIAATCANAEQSVREKGNVRFDFMRCKEEPNKFCLVEMYATVEQAAKHKETAHYLV